MTQCPGSISVQSKEFGYLETCGKRIEFLRRGCTFTPAAIEWAGDLVITRDAMLHQTKMTQTAGAACDPSHTFPEAGDDCGEKTVRPAEVRDVESKGIDEDDKSFAYTIEEGTPSWDIGVNSTQNELCGGMVAQDGGDLLFNFDARTQIKSLCGTVEMQSYAYPKAFYLDNRRSYPEDPDRGLLVSMQDGVTATWKVLYAKSELDLSSGLIAADDVTGAFTAALAALGMADEDVLEFGMI